MTPDVRPPAPVFEITFGRHSADCRVVVNGVDISGSLSGCRFECAAGELTKATLVVRHGSARATVQAAIENVAVEIEGAAT